MSQPECEALIREFRVHRFVAADHHAGRILYLIYTFLYSCLYLFGALGIRALYVVENRPVTVEARYRQRRSHSVARSSGGAVA